MQSRTRVRRRVIACARCRRRKLSCDGRVPACTRCVDAGVPCVGFDSSTQREAPRSIADFLEAHIARLEDSRSRPGLQQNQQTATFPSPSASVDSSSRPSPWNEEKGAFAGTLVNQVMVDITPRNLGVCKARPLLQCVVKGTQLPSKKGPVGSGDLNENHPRSIMNPQPTKSLFHDLIPDEVGANQLFQNYLDRIITQYPIYHRNDVTSAFNSIYHKKATNLGEDSVRNRYIVCIIMAISLSTTARSKVRKANSIAYQLVRHAMQWLPDVATNDIPGLQAVLILTQYIFLNPGMADLWLLTGLISQAIIDLGLHQELPNDPKISAYQRDMRRRLFWCAWEMDIGVSCIFLRATNLPIQHIEVSFPMELDDTAITQSGVDSAGRVSKFTQRIICRFRLIEVEVVSILWHDKPLPEDTTIDQWIERTISRTSEWQREVYAAANANQDYGLLERWREMALYSDIAYPYLLVMLYRSSRRIPNPTTYQLMIAIVNAVKVAAGYLQQSEAEPGRIKYVFHPCHHVFNCALVFLQGLQRCKQEISETYPWNQVAEWMQLFVNCFSSIAERWTAARRCLDEYERLLAPIKKEYLDFLTHKPGVMATSFRSGAFIEASIYDTTPPTSTPAQVTTEIDEVSNFWNVFNPTTMTDNPEQLGGFIYNPPPRDWNAEFSLNLIRDSLPEPSIS